MTADFQQQCCRRCGKKIGPGEIRYFIQEQYQKHGRWVTVAFACEECGESMTTRTRKWEVHHERL